VQAMLIRPPKFDAMKKISAAGAAARRPQTMWSNAWGYGGTRKCFRSGIRDADDQPPGLDGLRAEIHG